MTKENLITALQIGHQKFIDYIDSLSKTDFELHKNKKWSSGQELDHLVKSTLPLSQILNNKSFIASKFGRIDRNPMNYKELVEKYCYELKNGGVATGQFIPNEIDWIAKDKQKNRLLHQIEITSHSLQAYTEIELDELAIPHPLLGKLSIREMIYFTIYHVGHHLGNNKRNLENT